MAERRRLGERQVAIHGALPSLVHKKMSWPVVGVAVFLVVVPALTLHFFERIAFQNSLNQQQVAYGKLQAQADRQNADLKYIMNTLNTQLNCLQLQSDAASQLCKQHNATTRLQ